MKDLGTPDIEIYLETIDTNDVNQAARIAAIHHDSSVEWDVKGLPVIQCPDSSDSDAKLKSFKRK